MSQAKTRPDDSGLTTGAAQDLAGDVVERARRAGADAADVVLIESTSMSQAQRLGELENLERSEERDLGLRVLVGPRQACVSSTDLKRDALDELVERAVAMARAVPEDEYCGLAEPDRVAGDWPDLDSFDHYEPAAEDLIARAAAAEDAARAVEGVTNSEGAEAAWGRARIVLAASNGFVGAYQGSSHSVSVSVLAGEGTAMERDYDFTAKVHAEDLEDAAEVGRRAGEKAVRRLGAKQAKTGRYPVVFDPRIGNSLLRHFAGAINGAAVARGTSFLRDCMGQQVFAAGIRIVDDPLMRRGLASKPFDAEGLATRQRSLVDDGVLKTWVLDLHTARQLGLESTGNAARGTGGPPHPATTNLYLEPGDKTAAELMKEIGEGFYVTEMMGQGVNGVTGDYSRGAAGFWITGGELAYPVSGVTVAGNLKDMFLNLTPANDLEFRYGANAPTLLVEGMTVAGA